MKKLIGMSLAVLLTIFLTFGTGFAGDNSLPSSKAAVAISEMITLRAIADDPTQDDDTGWETILTTKIKTPNQKDLAFDVALQCGLVTDTTVKSKGGAKDVSAAKGTIRVRVKVTHPDDTFDYALPSEEGVSELGVTYCDRFQQLEAKFAGLDCFAAPYGVEGYCDEGTCISGKVGEECLTDDACDVAGGAVILGICDTAGTGLCTEGTVGDECSQDTDCDLTLAPGEVYCYDPEELRLLLETLNANAFNFLLPNLGPGVHTVEVQARAQANVDLLGTAFGEAKAQAFVGLGSMLVETVRLIKGAEANTEWFDLN